MDHLLQPTVSSDEINKCSSSTPAVEVDLKRKFDSSISDMEVLNQSSSRLIQISHQGQDRLLLNKFRRYYEDHRFFDLSIACQGGKIIRCHRAVVAAYSPVLEALLDNSPKSQSMQLLPSSTCTKDTKILTAEVDQQNQDQMDGNGAASLMLPIHHHVNNRAITYIPRIGNQTAICLSDFEAEDLDVIIRFMYTGRIEVPQTNLSKFYNIAQALQVQGFPLEISAEYIVNNENNDMNSVDITFSKIALVNLELDEETSERPTKICKTEHCPVEEYNLTSSGISSGSKESTYTACSSESETAEVKEVPIQPPAISKVIKSTSYIKRAFVKRDLERGYSLKEIATRHKISCKIIRRWRSEQRRLIAQKTVAKFKRVPRRNGFISSSDEELPPTPEELRASGVWYIVP